MRHLSLIAALLLAACDRGEDLLRLPPGFPAPLVPEDNPLTAEKAALGRRLFYDVRLSANGTQACATCHQQRYAFSDGRAQGLGSTGQLHTRGPMALHNVAYATTLTWANPLLQRLEDQALVPLFGDAPVELGNRGAEDALLGRLRADAAYPALFAAAFPADGEALSLSNIGRALASFQRTLISGRSPYDRLVYGGEQDALDASARRGMDLFFGEKLECFHCHGGFNFSDATLYAGGSAAAGSPGKFHNTGLYNLGSDGAYPAGNQGVYEISMDPADRGRFRAPSLRNIAVTAPYMHDGSLATLEDVLTLHYARGGRLIESGPLAGDGAKNPRKSVLVRGFSMTPDERDDILAFLRSLTDEEFLKDPRFSDPLGP